MQCQCPWRNNLRSPFSLVSIRSLLHCFFVHHDAQVELTLICSSFSFSNECSKVIIQSGIREVVYLNDYYHDTDACKASRIMFKMSGVKLRQYIPEHEEIIIDFSS